MRSLIFQISMNVKIVSLLSTVRNSVSIHLVVTSVLVMMVMKQSMTPDNV